MESITSLQGSLNLSLILPPKGYARSDAYLIVRRSDVWLRFARGEKRSLTALFRQVATIDC